MASWSDYATVHPRLDVVAIVTERNALAAMQLLMARDVTWGEAGVGDMVYLGHAKESLPCFSFHGETDCEHRGYPAGSIRKVIAEVKKRRADSIT